MSAALTQPPSECCWSGVKHSGNPVGRVESLGGLETYVSGPTSETTASTGSKKIILYLSDAYGPLYINNQLIQDYFASFGFTVLGPDYFLGDAVPNHKPPGRDKHAWVRAARDIAIKVFPKWLEAVKALYGTETTKYFAVGYCFGAPFVMELAADGLIEAGAIAHPGLLEESHFEELKRPLLLSCAEDDFTFPLDARRRAEDILVRNKSTYYFQTFSGVQHGFAVRGDPDIPQERWAKEESARGVKEWFLRFGA